MADDDEADPVVREMDIFLTDSLSHAAYLLQFPLQNPSASAPGDLLRGTTECRMKPQRNLMEVDLAMDTECSNYDPESKLCSETRTLKSSVVPPRANYAIGAVRGGELHLTPLHATLQLRPSFHKVNEHDERLRDAAGTRGEDRPLSAAAKAKAAAEAKAAAAGSPQLYQVTIKRAETERTIERRQRSHAYLERERKKEPWVPVDVNHLGSNAAAQEYQRLFSDVEALMPPILSKSSYLDLVSPPLSLHQDTSSVTTQMATLSMHALGQMSVPRRVSQLLRHAGVLRFDRLMALCGVGAEGEPEIVAALEEEATIVRGCWVWLSTLAHPDSEHLALCRDHLCSLMVQHDFVDRQKFTRATGLGDSLADTLFSSLTVKVSGKGFRIKLAADQDFCRRHSQLVEKHRAQWLSKAPDIDRRVVVRQHQSSMR
eukprot:COSAG01_NODE_2892_length_6906_cov_7.041134_1_plen_429_part_00